MGIFGILFAHIWWSPYDAKLFDTQRRKEGITVVFISLFFSGLTFALVNISDSLPSIFTYVCNAVGGYYLSVFHFKKHFPIEENYPKKKYWKALIISLLITIPFITALIYITFAEQ